MILEKKVSDYIQFLSEKGLYRQAAPYRQNLRLNFCSNDYLSLSTHPKVIESACAALQKYGCGSAASRLVYTTHPLHHDLQQVLAGLIPKTWQGILLSSGYLANLAFFDLFRNLKVDIEIFVDHRAHSSLIAAVRNSGYPVYFYPHKNFVSLSEKVSRSKADFKIVVSEALHSMDGDFEDLSSLVDLCRTYKGTYVYMDESHATGLTESVFWSFGAASAPGIQPFLLGVMSGCGKAIGSSGGLLLLPQFLCELAFQSARPLIYSTALPPAQVAAVKESLNVLGSAEGIEIRQELQKKLSYFYRSFLQFKNRLRKDFQVVFSTINGVAADAFFSPIVTIYSGASSDLLGLKESLEADSIAVGYMRPPTVPKGTERLRLSLSLQNDTAEYQNFFCHLFENGG